MVNSGYVWLRKSTGLLHTQCAMHRRSRKNGIKCPQAIKPTKNHSRPHDTCRNVYRTKRCTHTHTHARFTLRQNKYKYTAYEMCDSFFSFGRIFFIFSMCFRSLSLWYLTSDCHKYVVEAEEGKKPYNLKVENTKNARIHMKKKTHKTQHIYTCIRTYVCVTPSNGNQKSTRKKYITTRSILQKIWTIVLWSNLNYFFFVLLFFLAPNWITHLLYNSDSSPRKLSWTDWI